MAIGKIKNTISFPKNLDEVARIPLVPRVPPPVLPAQASLTAREAIEEARTKIAARRTALRKRFPRLVV